MSRITCGKKHFVPLDPTFFTQVILLITWPVGPPFLPPPSWDSKGCYLTRSMTLSRGASLTVSSLMAKIWSPGRSFPKEGPSADETRMCINECLTSAVALAVFWCLSFAHTCALTCRDGAYNDRPLAACNEAKALSWVPLDGDLSSWGRT